MPIQPNLLASHNLRPAGLGSEIVSKPLPHDGLTDPREKARAQARMDNRRRFAAELDGMDFSSLWRDRDSQKDRIIRRVSIAAQDSGAI